MDNYEDDELNDLFEESTPIQDTSQVSENKEGNLQIESVSWSKAKTGVLAMVVIFFLIIMLLTIKSMHISKKSENSAVSETTELASTETESTVVEIVEETTSPESDISTVSSESSSTMVEEVSTENIQTTEVKEEVKVQELDNIQETVLPELSDIQEATGIVLSKNVYKVKTNYLYELEIIIVVGESNVTVSYYCPKNPFDAAESGMAVTVKYQTDAEGNVSIVGISA